MAASSNKSPSPTSNRQNPSSRSTDQNPIARRSLSGSPFSRPPILSNPKSFNPNTPANSPSDWARNSGEFCSRAFEDKENEKDHSLKHTKVRSPAVLKMGSKNFMAPTISAASKFTPSPRKKVLGERNDSSVRTSISDSFEKVVERFEMNSELGSEENAVEVTLSDFHTKPDSLGGDDDDHSLKKMPISSSVSPSPPPYDPKTNYLSPRPQFLHFKPNPRIESYLGKENGEIKRLDDIFELENLSSDSEVTEESGSNDSPNESCEEEDSSPEIITKEAEHQEEESTDDLHLVSAPQEFRRKSRFFSRLRFISLLMILVVGFLSFSATDSPIFNGSSVLKDSSIPKFYSPSELKDVFEEFVVNLSSVLKDSSIPKLYHPSELKDVFEEFVMNFKDWSSKHISSYVSKVIRRRNGLDKPPATIQFYNLSSFQEYALINRGRFVDHIELDLGEMYDQDFEDEDETEEELQEENGNSEIEEEEETENEIIESGITEAEPLPLQAEFDQNEEQSSVNDANLVLIPEVESPSVVGDDVLIHEVDSSSAVGEEQSSLNYDANLVLINEVDSSSVVDEDVLINEVDSSSVSADDANLVLIQEVDSPSVVVGDDVLNLEVDSSSVVVGEELSSSSTIHNLLTEANSRLDQILATISVLLVILVPAFLYVNHHQKRNEVNTAEATRVLDDEPAPCSSESSSSQASVANKKRLMETAAAAEKRVAMKSNSNYSRKRESLASSSTEFSMDSPSYGSFTTYEKMVTKKNGYDEEIVTTPVRRSSRIRSQVLLTSP